MDVPLTDSQATILLIDGDQAHIETLKYSLGLEGYKVLLARDGKEGISLAYSERPYLVILELVLPDVSGLDVCRALREELTMPILILSTRDDEVYKVLALELGADDYVTKPFGQRELVSRIRALLRRQGSLDLRAVARAPQIDLINPTNPDELRVILTSGDLVINLASRTLTLRGKRVPLFKQEYAILAFLAAHQGTVFSREDLLQQVFGKGPNYQGAGATVSVPVRRLRKKIEQNPDAPEIIQTVVGYRFTQPVTVHALSNLHSNE